MAEGGEQDESQSLGDLFKSGFDLYSEIDAGTMASNTDEYQKKVKAAIRHFEDSTRLVNSIGMFSTNEIIDEIPTEHLKYLLLPYFLGQLMSQCMSYNRAEALKLSDIYYKDFLKRCMDYSIIKTNNPNENAHSENLAHLALQRNAKLEMFRKKKELEAQVKQMKIALENEHVDDEVKRDFYLKLIDISIIRAKEELPSIDQETQILQFKAAQADKEGEKRPKKFQSKTPRVPLKPIIITKDAMQKAVYGAGYPSLPVFSVDEFYDQRVREGIFPTEEKVAEMNKKALNPEDPEEKEDREKAETEALIEKDDEEYLQRQRNLDEHKDVVRRGAGNRYNRS